MIVENSANENYIQIINLRCFPRNVLDFEDSHDFLQQILFLDYQLDVIIRKHFNSKHLSNVNNLPEGARGAVIEKLDELVTCAKSIHGNYSQRSYEEVLYYSTVLAHLYQLRGFNFEFRESLDLLNGPSNQKFDSLVVEEFRQYLKCRYSTIMGLTTKNVWSDFLLEHRQSYHNSQLAARFWLNLMHSQLLDAMASQTERPLSFQDVQKQPFASNKISFVRFLGFILRKENTALVDPKFKQDFGVYIVDQIQKEELSKSSSSDTSRDGGLETYVDVLYDALKEVPNSSSIVKPKLLKSFLINCTKRTFRSRLVLANFVKTLIDLNEYDEALAAFNVYISYEKKEQELAGGHIDDILTVVGLYSLCIRSFNPLSSLLSHSKRVQKFSYNDDASIRKHLEKYTRELCEYLKILSYRLDLRYDDDLLELANNPLSFLSHIYNPHVSLSNQSELIHLISKSWFCIGYYYYYLAIHEASTYAQLSTLSGDILSYYKKSLIIDNMKNVRYGFNYALVLAYSNELKHASKLCKHILKIYPQSFKTWQLLVLLMTSFEAQNPSYSKRRKQKGDVHGETSFEAEQSSKVRESEKFINSALNAASLFIKQYSEAGKKISDETKYEILQLKITQVAVLESIHGVSYIVDFIQEVFLLYNELFDVRIDSEHGSRQVAPEDAKWSHRPSFIDHKTFDNETSERDTSRFRGQRTSFEKVKRVAKVSKKGIESAGEDIESSRPVYEKIVLQELWSWAFEVYMRAGLLEDAEQCIVEEESAYQPNFKTFTDLGLLTSKQRKFLSLQEFEKSLEILSTKEHSFNKKDYGKALLGIATLFILDDSIENSLFFSEKDLNAGTIRLKNLLEKYSLSWSYGYNSAEVWWFLSKIYEKIDDRFLLNESLWRTIKIEEWRPVREFRTCDGLY